ncbi:MAG: hypothetical protein DRJ40_08960 [Thermoprotei archaeon]|nr:MAG: hypothetical protein DRJ40_08960 [Thermoprotei archaeon]
MGGGRRRRFRFVEERGGKKYYLGVELPYFIAFIVFLIIGIIGFVLPFFLSTPPVDLVSVGVGVVGILLSTISYLTGVSRGYMDEFREEMREFRREMRDFRNEVREFREEVTALLRRVVEVLEEIRGAVSRR